MAPLGDKARAIARSLRRTRRVRLGAAVTVVGLGAIGCGGPEPGRGADGSGPDTAVVPATPVDRVAERGPVTLTTTVADDEVAVGDLVEFTVSVQAGAGVQVGVPVFEDTVGDLGIDSSVTPPDVPDPDGGRRTVHRYLLYTFSAGPHEIPGITITFRDDNRPEPIAQELSTEPILVEVGSVVEADADPTALRAIKDPVEVAVPTDWNRVAIVAASVALAAGALLAIAAVLLRRARARRAAPPPPVPAHVWARSALRALEADDLLGRGALHEFYVRLSDIVRGYLERRFELHAPEQTTDEFLRDTERGGTEHGVVLEVGHRVLLAEFLRAADLVKFARLQPTPEEGRGALGKAHAFVDETALLGDRTGRPVS